MKRPKSLPERIQDGYREEGYAYLAKEGIKLLSRKTVRTFYSLPVIDHLTFLYSKKDIERRMRKEQDLEDMLETAGTFYNPGGKYRGMGNYKSLWAIQSKEELSKTAKKVASHEPSTVVEIGTYRGGTLYIWSRFLDSATTIISIDKSHRGRKKLFERFASYSGKELFCIEENSHAPETKEKVKEILSGDKIDFLYIDGDHTYEGVKTDFEMYLPLMSEDGLVALHDIKNENTEVPRFWEELKEEYRCTEAANKNIDATGIVEVEKRPESR